MFGDKGMLPLGPTSFYAVTLDEYRKASYPIPVTNSWSLFLGSLAAMARPVLNYGYRKPAFAGGYQIVLLGAAGMWVGYYMQRAYEQYYFGKFKYCLDYALKRKDFFPKHAPLKYSDPGVLSHWTPVR